MTKTKGQCQFGMNGTGFRCELPATRKWGDNWFCEEHGKREKTIDTKKVYPCPFCESPFKETFNYKDSEGVLRQVDIFECGSELIDGEDFCQDSYCIPNQRDNLLKEREILIDLVNQFESLFDEAVDLLRWIRSPLPPKTHGEICERINEFLNKNGGLYEE